MRKLLPLLLLAASCGGQAKPATAPSNQGKPVADSGKTYGDDWGEYGPVGDGYGGSVYGGIVGGQGYGVGYGYGEGYGYGGGGYGGGYDGNYTPPPPQPPSIVGTWVAACKARADKDFDTFTFVMTDAKWDLTIARFGDAACTKRKSALHLAGSYTFGAQSAAVATAWEGNFTYEAIDLTADDAKTAKAIGKLCGIKKMKAGTAVDIHDKGCAKMGRPSVAACGNDYDVVALDGDRLRFGVRPADNDMCTVEKRPTALDTTTDNVFQYASTGVPECDQMVEGYKAYMHCAALPADSRTAVFDSIRQSIPQLAQMGASSCQAATQSLQQALASMGC